VLACTWCGSQRLAWMEEGYIVCQSCGSVVSSNHYIEEAEARRPAHAYRVRRLARRMRVAGHPWLWGHAGPVRARGGAETKAAGLGFRRPGGLANRKAEKLLNSSSRLSFIASLVDCDPLLKARALRTRVALAVYLELRSRGYSKRRSLRIASSLTGSSETTLERVISKYRDRIEILERRI